MYGFATKKSITDKVKKHYPDSYKQIIEEARNNRKNYSIDLKIIDSEFKAYFIGLMLTDGYISGNNKFGLQMTDEDVIKYIADVTNNTYYPYDYSNGENKTDYRIIFSNHQQIEYLKRYGIVERKSRILSPPALYPEEEKFLPYIFRGIIDGDGCIFYTSKKTPAFYICSMSQDFIYWCKDILENRLFMKDIHITQSETGVWYASTSLLTNMQKLYSLIYDKPFGMSRKYNRLREMFRDYNKSNQKKRLFG